MNRGVFILLFIVFLSCNHNSNENNSISDKKINSVILKCDTFQNKSLILLIHSGHVKMEIQDSDTSVVSETQIIYCSPTSIKYGYGSVLAESDTIANDLEWFSDYPKIEDYSIIERNLDTKEQIFVDNSIKELLNTRYENPIVVKDDWEYILYVNNIKVASGNVSSLDSFPQKIHVIIERLLKMVSPLYPRNAFA